MDEGMLQWGLYAAALRLPFLPTRAGLGSDALSLNPWLRTVRSPYDDGEELVAMQALELDAALVHVNRADPSGNAQVLGHDPYFDDLFCMAARRRFVSCERIVPTEELLRGGPIQTMRIHRGLVDGVVEAAHGAAFTSCEPDYGRDEEAQRAYAASASQPGGWAAFYSRFVESVTP
jgi:glutaconate CoA-transferase subunit A